MGGGFRSTPSPAAGGHGGVLLVMAAAAARSLASVVEGIIEERWDMDAGGSV